jgi:hypothetical protein
MEVCKGNREETFAGARGNDKDAPILLKKSTPQGFYRRSAIGGFG